MHTITFKKQLFNSLTTGLIASFCAFSNPAAAAVATLAQLNVSGGVGGTITDYGILNGNTSTASVSGYFGNSAALAQYGVLKASTSARVESGSANGYASAGYSDYLTLNNPGLTGLSGSVTFAYYIAYNSSVAAVDGGFSNGDVSFMARAGAYDYTWFLDYASTDGRGYTMMEFQDPNHAYTRTYHVDPPSFIYVTTNFIWGSPIYNELGLILNASESGNTSFNFDAGHSGYWAGVTSVTTNGTIIADYTLTSQSGTDYSHSFVPTAKVPEPATLCMVGLGIALMGARRKRRAFNK
jgi:hypothetical protein